MPSWISLSSTKQLTRKTWFYSFSTGPKILNEFTFSLPSWTPHFRVPLSPSRPGPLHQVLATSVHWSVVFNFPAAIFTPVVMAGGVPLRYSYPARFLGGNTAAHSSGRAEMNKLAPGQQRTRDPTHSSSGPQSAHEATTQMWEVTKQTSHNATRTWTVVDLAH